MQLDEPKIVKTIVPANCPHCSKQLFVSFQMMIPTAVSVITDKDIKDAKADALSRLQDITLKNPERKKEIEDWLNKETTLIEPLDVDSLIKQILNEESQDEEQHDNTKEDTTK